MKKCVIKLILILLLGTLVACKGKENTNDNSEGKQQETENVGKVTETPSTDESIGDSITEEIVRKYKVANEIDFEYDLDEAGTGIKITKYLGDDVIVVIPQTISGKTVTELKAYLFANDSSVKGVFIPETVKTLRNTFVNNDDIQVIICEGVESLQKAAMLNCASLHTLVLGDDLWELGEFCISACPMLKEVYISDKVTTIVEYYDDYNLLKDCKSLTIVGKVGSFIENYAKEKDIPFKVKE